MNRTTGRTRSWRWSEVSLEFRILLGLGLILAAIVISNQFGVLTPDTKPEAFLQPGQTARRFASSWLDTPNLGAANYNVGTAALAAIFAVADGLGIPSWLAMRLWRIALLVIGALGARLVVRDLIGPRVSGSPLAIAGVAAAVAYAMNPYVVVGGGTTPTLQPYALLPWLVVCWLRGARNPSWRWAALGALAMAAMGGINAGIVPLMQLVVIVPVMLHTVWVEGHHFWSVMWLIVRTGLVYVLLSAYWLIPALFALGSGVAVAVATESVTAINMANSFPEVLRGLGMWTLYGMGGTGPFDPFRLGLVTTPLVVLLSFGGPIIAALGVRMSRSPARVFGATATFIGALIMAVPFVGEDSSVLGRAMRSVFETVPGLVALRTTNKVGGVLELGLAVLIGLAAVALAARLKTMWQRGAALVTGALVAAGGIAPAMTGGLFWIPMDMPDYWFEAAETVNARGGDSRVMMVPGVGVTEYAWGYSGPDELGPSLFTRPFVYRSAALSGEEHGAAMLAEVDRRLQQGTLPTGTMSTLADYLGVGDIVGRYDLARSDVPGGRVEAALDADPGLSAPDVFGPREVAHGAAGAVTVRSVEDSRSDGSARLARASSALIIDGSGAALPALTEAGLTEGTPALLLAGDLDDAQLAEAMADGGRLVLTDSNLRREWSSSNPTGVGPVLSRTETPDRTYALFDADAQSTAEQRGKATVTTSGEGFLFGPFEFGAVEQAFDDDASTAWRFGNFGTGVGNAVHIVAWRPMPMPSITLAPAQGGGSWITAVRITAVTADRTIVRDVELARWNSFPTQVHLGDEPITELSVEVTGVDGDGDGPVGFSEITVDGLQVTRVVHLSDELTRRVAQASDQAGVDLAGVPIDVIMERSSGDDQGLGAGESRLEREFVLPDDRRFVVGGLVRLAAGVSDAAMADLAGRSDVVRAQASSRLFNRPQARAEHAVDSVGGRADLTTAWVPNDPVVGEWIAVDFPERRLSSFAITQNEGPDIATGILVSINDEEPFEATLDAGRTVVRLPEPTDASRVRVLITDRQGLGFVRFTDISLPRVVAQEGPPECVTIATIDRRPLRARVGDRIDDLLRGEAILIESCGTGPLLSAGEHRIGSVPDFAIDLLHLQDEIETSPPDTVSLDIVEQDVDRIMVRAAQDCSPCVLSSGQAFDPRWTARADGAGLGPPIVVDGFAAGWRVQLDEGAVVTMEFGPRRAGLIGWWLSLGAWLAVPASLTLSRSTRRWS